MESHRAQHAPLCGLMTKLSLVAGGKNPLDKNPGHCLQLATIAKMIMKRNLTQFESDILMFPRLCNTCSSFLGSVETTVTCPACTCTIYCSDTCLGDDVDHKNHCEEIKHNRDDYLYSRNVSTKEMMSGLNVSDIARVPHDMMDALHMLDTCLSLDTPRGRHVSSLLSSPLTCLSALIEHVDLSKSSQLTIHLVGSRKIERSSPWSILLSALAPKIEKIRLIFIGLEVISPDEDDDDMSWSHPQLEMIHIPPCPYDQYAASDDYQEPDLVCAFNCGFILYSTWSASIPHMLRSSGAPLVFTEYYDQDCRSNLDLVTSLVSEPEPVILSQDVSLNKFRSRQSQRSPLVMWGQMSSSQLQRAPVIADNNHVVVVRRRTI